MYQYAVTLGSTTYVSGCMYGRYSASDIIFVYSFV